MFYGNGWMWGMHGLGWIFWIVVLGAVVYLVMRQSNRNAGGSKPTAREIRDRRYAAGEISTQEYDERKAKLQ